MSTTVGSPPVPTTVAPRSAPPQGQSLRTLIAQGLRDQRRTLLIWGLCFGAFGAFMAAIYPSIQHSIDQLVKNYPSGLKEAFGVQSMNSVEGYIHAELFSLIVPLAMGYFAIRGIAGATVGAEERGYLDTILSLPISRRVLMAGAYVVTAIGTAAVLLMTGLFTFAVGRIAGTHISLGLVIAGVMGVWPLCLFFGGVSALACGVLHRPRTVTGLSLGLLVGMYAIDLAGRLAHALEPIRWASAFRYYGAPMRDGIDPLSFVGLTAVGTMIAIAGAYLLERRDVLH